MSEDGNTLYVLDRECGYKWRITYWNEHTAEDVLRRLRPAAAVDVYELFHEEFRAVPPDQLLIDMALSSNAILTLRERRSGSVSTGFPIQVILDYTSADGAKADGQCAFKVGAGISYADCLAEIRELLPRKPKLSHLLFWEKNGLFVDPATVLTADPGTDLRLKDQLQISIRVGGKQAPAGTHPTVLVDQLLKWFLAKPANARFASQKLALYMDGAALPVDKTLGQCQVRQGAVLDLMPAGAQAVTASAAPLVSFTLAGLMYPNPERVVIQGSRRVAELVQEQATKLRLPAADCHLIASGVALGPADMMGAVVKDGDTVHLVRGAPPAAPAVGAPAKDKQTVAGQSAVGPDVKLEFLHMVEGAEGFGRKFTPTCPRNTTVGEFVAMVADKFKIRPGEVAMEADGALLPPHVMIAQHAGAGVVLRLVRQISSQQSPTLPLTMPTGIRSELTALANETVANVVQRLVHQHGLVGRFGLFVGDQQIPQNTPAASLTAYAQDSRFTFALRALN